MHIWTLAKIHSEDKENARSYVESEFQESVTEDSIFDYVGDVTVMEMTDAVKKEFEVETLEELEAKYRGYSERNVVDGERRIKEELHLLLAKKYLKAEDAALLINDPNTRLQSAAQEILKTDGGKELPKNLNELVDGVAEAVLASVGDFGSMFTYVLKNYSHLKSALDDPEDTRTAMESTDNHFIDFTLDAEDDDSLPLFYVLVDRHY
jgi:hypothetical protein